MRVSGKARKRFAEASRWKGCRFQVLDRNIFETPAEEIGSIKVLMTIVGGKVVYLQ
jgi:hypothetical protein